MAFRAEKVTMSFAPAKQRLFSGWRVAASLIALIGCSLILTTSTAGAFEKLEQRTNLQAVYFLPVPSSDRVNVQLIISAGEADASGPEGIAHFVEHLALFQSIGDLRTSPIHHLSNGYTRSDMTTYVAAGRPEHLGKLLIQLAKVLRAPQQSQELMRRERNVVLREYDLRVVENVGRRLYERLGKVLYEGHPLGRLVLGTPQTIAQMTPEKARDFHRRFYTASNATLVIVGNAQRSDLVQLVEESFGAYSGGKRTPRVWRTSGHWPDATLVISERDDVAKRPMVMVRELFDVGDFKRRELAVALPLLQSILGSARPGGLENDLVHDNYLVSGFGLNFQLVTKNTVEAMFWAFPAENIEPRRVVDAYRSAIKQLVTTGIPEATVARVRKQAQRHAERQQTNEAAQAQRATHWISNDLAPPEFAAENRQIANLSTEKLNRLLASLQNARRTVVGYVSPKHEGAN